VINADAHQSVAHRRGRSVETADMTSQQTTRLYVRIDADVTPEGFTVIHITDNDEPYTLQDAATDVRFGSDIPYEDGIEIADFDLHHDELYGYLRDAKGRVYGKLVDDTERFIVIDGMYRSELVATIEDARRIADECEADESHSGRLAIYRVSDEGCAEVAEHRGDFTGPYTISL
jgi:hypothetical protein